MNQPAKSYCMFMSDPSETKARMPHYGDQISMCTSSTHALLTSYRRKLIGIASISIAVHTG